MALTDMHCIPCEGGTAPLSIAIEDELLKQVPGWEIDRLFEHKIKKTFTLKSFPGAIDFVNKIAAISEREGHHPELYINFRKVTVVLYTHAILGLSGNDFILAAKIDGILAETVK
jgi:4a-hydroxytetrahydrobiopterin dehydratase